MKWMLFDMDGTLLNDEHKMPEGTYTFLNDAKAKGYKLGIITGRPFFAALLGLKKEEIELFDFISTYNGARVDYKGKTHTNKISIDMLKEIQGNFAITLADDEKTMYIDKIKYGEAISKRYDVSIKKLSDYKEKDAYYIRLIFDCPKETTKVFKELNEKYGDRYNVIKSTGVFILITDKTISKGEVIKKFFNSNDEIYFFGDSDNDLSAISLDFVKGVAPINANDNIKKISSIVLETSNNETLRIEI